MASGSTSNRTKPAIQPDAYADHLPEDIAAGRTGLACIDAFAIDLRRVGWLHNHARMWLASYVVHWRRVSWQAGARWFLGHLLDGDPASNNLSWQWVASTFQRQALHLQPGQPGAFQRRPLLQRLPPGRSRRGLTSRRMSVRVQLRGPAGAPVSRQGADHPGDQGEGVRQGPTAMAPAVKGTPTALQPGGEKAPGPDQFSGPGPLDPGGRPWACQLSPAAPFRSSRRCSSSNRMDRRRSSVRLGSGPAPQLEPCPLRVPAGIAGHDPLW